LSTSVARHPESAALQIEMGWVALDLKQFEAARGAFGAALRQAPGSFDAQSGLVATHLAANDLASARGQVEEWRSATPGNRSLDVLAARVELTAGNSADAERILQSVVAADGTELDAYELLGRLYVSQGKLDRAIEQYDTLARRAPRPTGPRTMAAMLHEARGDRPRARQAYEAIVAGDARAGIASNNLAWIYAEEGKLDDALRLARIAQEQMMRRPEGEDTLGWVQLRRGLTADAIAAFTRAVGRAPKNPVYHYHLGLAYLKIGDKARGHGELQRALTLSPDFNGAEDARQQLSQRSGM
jgi:tetratricopeptide (TPR) repeat protein